MEQIKRQRCDSFDDNKRRKTEDCPITRFEDFANEILYEIFDYLDSYHAYKGFSSLNYRFQSFLIKSTLPLRINIPLMSSSTFHRYNNHIIQRNLQRTHSIHISNHFMYDIQTLPLVQMTFLQRLVVENIESKCLENLLNQLTLLSHLSSLSITTIDTVTHQTPIYQQIFRLSSLRYCKLLLRNQNYHWYSVSSLHLNEQSSIEYLIIDYEIKYRQLKDLLSCVPRLRHFSFQIRPDFESLSSNVPCHVPDSLTYLSLKSNCRLAFEELERTLVNHFPLVEVLRISVSIKTLDANKWKQLISTHLLKLRIFDVRLEVYSSSEVENAAYEEQVIEFQSSFWIERQWFFRSELIRKRHLKSYILYSTNLYRKKDYLLYKQSYEENFTDENRTMFSSVDHVQIEDEKAVHQCMCYFPNATKVTLEDRFSTAGYAKFSIVFNRILSLQRIKTLVIKYDRFSVMKMINLLTCIPNLQTLAFQSMSLYKKESKSIEQSKKFQSLSKINRITNVSFEERSTLDKIELLVKLFPRIQYFEMNVFMRHMEAILQLLLLKQNMPNLPLICFTSADEAHFRHLTDLIRSNMLSSDYKVAYAERRLYLW
ncbi:unnamed protein product [Adineta ricciae]|uniref:F-box domain-containing protein n=1 Tax=Adineta ricciae TaxID=249248 RepID=A0A814NXC6_ADIRI|nr:unnamed protein product [Adineta ricciae]